MLVQHHGIATLARRRRDRVEDRATAIPSAATVVGRHVQWDRRKSNPGKGDFWACCPFHTEKSPSFHADDRKGHYYCFGCKASSDIFRFLVEREGLRFPEGPIALFLAPGDYEVTDDHSDSRAGKWACALASGTDLDWYAYRYTYAYPYANGD